MKWKILISILLLFPVFNANAKDPEIGITIEENLFFGEWKTSSGWSAIIRIIRGNNNMPERIELGGGFSALNNYWHAAKIRVSYIANGSSYPIHVTGIQIPTGTLYNEKGAGQIPYNVESYYWVEGTASPQFVLSPSNPEVIVYIGGAAQPSLDAAPGIYTNYGIQVTIDYWINKW